MDWYSVVGPLLRRVPPEVAHRTAIRVLTSGLIRDSSSAADDPRLAVPLWGQRFPNPVGLAAGFDKNGEVADRFPHVGFVEVGTVTPEPQGGNPRPRVFRLPEDHAVINRLGFNNDGMQTVRARLEWRDRKRIVGVNVGHNRESSDPVGDYAAGVRYLAPVADYIVLNVSSPNTPGLRDLQLPQALKQLVGAVLRARRDLTGSAARVPVLLKISPDLADEMLADVVGVAMESTVDGMIIGNTTLSRPGHLKSRKREERGGLSGRPLLPLSTQVLQAVADVTRGRMPLVGVGGISSGEDAYMKIAAGASLVQVYTGLIYHGPGLVSRIKEELLECLKRDGFASVTDAVGTKVR